MARFKETKSTAKNGSKAAGARKAAVTEAIAKSDSSRGRNLKACPSRKRGRRSSSPCPLRNREGSSTLEEKGFSPVCQILTTMRGNDKQEEEESDSSVQFIPNGSLTEEKDWEAFQEAMIILDSQDDFQSPKQKRVPLSLLSSVTKSISSQGTNSPILVSSGGSIPILPELRSNTGSTLAPNILSPPTSPPRSRLSTVHPRRVLAFPTPIPVSTTTSTTSLQSSLSGNINLPSSDKKRKRFQMQAKKFFLTFPQCETTKEQCQENILALSLTPLSNQRNLRKKKRDLSNTSIR